MKKKPLDLVADILEIPIFEARKLLTDIQNRVTPAPPYKLIAEILINNPDISNPDEIASIITGFDTEYQFKYQQINPESLLRDQDVLYRLVAQYLYPKIPYKRFKKIKTEHIKDKSPFGIADYISKNVEGYVLKENINLYKRVKFRTYPKTSTADFSRIRDEYPEVISLDSFVRLLITQLGYIRIEDKSLYLKVKAKLYPTLPVKTFSDVLEIVSDRKTQIIIDTVIREFDEYVLDKDYQKIKVLIFPEPDPKFLNQFLKKKPEINDPGEIAQKLASDFAQYIPVCDSPLYNRVNSSFLEPVPVEIFSACRSNIADPYSFEDIVNNIDDNYPALQMRLYKEMQQMIVPKPSIKQLRKVRISSGLKLSKSELVGKFLDNSLNYIQTKDLNLYKQVKKRIYPSLRIRVFNQSRKVLSGSSVVQEIVNDISNSSLEYMSTKSFKKLNQYLFPAVSKSEALEFKKNAWVGISSQELAKFISEKSNQYISGSNLVLFMEIDQLVYPDLKLDDFWAVLNLNGDTASAESLSISLEGMEHKYILLSKCNQVRKLLYPEISNREILNHYHSRSSVLNSEELASLIKSENGKYSFKKSKIKKKGINISNKWDWNY